MLARAFGCNASCWDIADNRNMSLKQNRIQIIEPEDLLPESFDIINCDNILEHVAEPRDLIGILARVLKGGGVLSVWVPNCFKLKKFIKRRDVDSLFSNRSISGLVHPLEHINSFTQLPLMRLAEFAGLSKIKPSMLKIYACNTYWFGARRILKNLIGPIRSRLPNRSEKFWLAKS